MRDSDIKQLKVSYGSTMPSGPNDVRLAAALGLKVERGIELGDRLLAGLSDSTYGFGWWTAYPQIDRQTRIFLSDHLVACARSIATNLIEAYTEGLEFRHALDEFDVADSPFTVLLAQATSRRWQHDSEMITRLDRLVVEYFNANYSLRLSWFRGRQV